jgi:hypothetical protein
MGLRASDVMKSLKRFILGPKWTNLKDAYFEPPTKSKFRGAYWYWQFFDLKSRKQLCLFFTRIPLNIKLNGIQFKKQKGRVLITTAWFFDGKKFIDLIISSTSTKFLKDKLEVNCKSGHKIILSEKFPSYTIEIYEKGKKTAEFTSKSSEIEALPSENNCPHKDIHELAYSEKKESFLSYSEHYQFPFATKQVDLISPFTGHYKSHKMKGKVWTERLKAFAVYSPWKFTKIHFENGDLFSAYWYFSWLNYGVPINAFYYSKKDNKRYYFKKNSYNYLTDKGKVAPELQPNVKYIQFKGASKNAKIEFTAEILGKHCYMYENLLGEAFYGRFIPELKNFKLNIKGKNYTLKKLGSHAAYAEHSDMSRLLWTKRYDMEGLF